MEKQKPKNVTLSTNSVGYKGKTFNRYNIKHIEYKEPRGIFMSIIVNIFKYAVFIVFVLGIPFAILAMYYDVKYYRVILTLNESDKKGKNKEVIWHVTKEEYDYIIENY